MASETFRTGTGKVVAGVFTSLDERLRPTSHSTSEWRDTSGGGFLAPHETYLEVVEKDSITLKELGVDHGYMAKLAARVLEQSAREAKAARSDGVLGVVREYLARNYRPALQFDRDRFSLLGVGSLGHQSCPWECNSDQDGYAVRGSGHVFVQDNHDKEAFALQRKFGYGQIDLYDKGASEEEVREFERSLGVEFGGNDRLFYLTHFTVVTDLTPHLISKHFFFQGDGSYRTDPKKLLEFAE